MRARHLVLLLGLYVSLDFMNPFMPGAFNFSPDDSVDGIRLHYEMFRSRLAVIPTPPSIRDATSKRPVVAPEPADPPAVSAWFVDLRQRQSSSAESPPTDDH